MFSSANKKEDLCIQVAIKARGLFCVKIAIVLVVLCSGLLSSGCTMTHEIHAKPSLESLLETEKLPLKAGIYYSPAFKSFDHSRISGPHKFVVPIGQDSVNLFDQVFPLVFEETTHVNGLPPYAVQPADIDVVIEPFIEHFHFRMGLESLSDKHNITYRFTLYSLDGAPVSTWRVMGKPEAEKQSTFVVYRHIDVDLEDAAIKFTRGFKQDSGIMERIDHLPQNGGSEHYVQLSDEDLVFEANPTVEYIHLKDDKDVSLNEGGIVVVKVVLENHGDEPINVNPSNFRLILPGKGTIAPSGVSAIFPRFEERNYSGDVSAIAFGALIGTIISAAEEHAENKSRIPLEADLKNKMFENASLVKGQTAGGLLYFIPSDEVEDFDTANLSLWISNNSSQNLKLTKSLQNIGYKKNISSNSKK
jgi:hypothetical protein